MLWAEHISLIGFIIILKYRNRDSRTAENREKIGDPGTLRTRTLNSRLVVVPRRVSSSSRSRSAPSRVCARENINPYPIYEYAKREHKSRNPGHIPLQDAYFTLKRLKYRVLSPEPALSHRRSGRPSGSASPHDTSGTRTERGNLRNMIVASMRHCRKDKAGEPLNTRRI